MSGGIYVDSSHNSGPLSLWVLAQTDVGIDTREFAHAIYRVKNDVEVKVVNPLNFQA